MLSEAFSDARDRLVGSDQIRCFSRIFPLGKFDADKFTDPVLFHGHAVQNIRFSDRSFVMRDDDKLALLDEAVQDLDKPANVGLVEGASISSSTQKGLGLTI